MVAISTDTPKTPRTIDPEATFESIVQWIQEKASQERAPGLIVGISGTDSILTYLTCAEAFKRLDKADHVIGVHYGPKLSDEETGATDSTLCMVHEFNWVAKDIFPWLKQKSPESKLELDSSDGYNDDNVRWGRLFSRAVRDTDNDNSLSADHYFTVGTRNATEDFLGTYSQVSKAVSIQPLIHLYKSEVLKLCEYLNVPQIAMDKSRQVDCNCGRFDTAANHLEEVDAYIMKSQGLLSKDYIEKMPSEVKAAIMEYVLEEESRNNFRTVTPYRPQESLVITK